jgi:hypothetical protein
MHILDGSALLMNINEFRITYALPTYLCKVKRRNNIDQSYVYVDNFWEKCRCLQYSWQHTLINAEHLKGSAFNAEVLLGVVDHGLMISFITLTCTDGQQLNKQYDHNDFQVDVLDSIGVSKINLSMYVWFVTLVTFYLGLFQKKVSPGGRTPSI